MSSFKHLEEREIKKLFNVITSKRDQALFTLIYLYGLRVSEAIRLKHSDIRIFDKRINIQASKNGHSGEQFLSKEAIRVLQIWITEKESVQKEKSQRNRTLPPSKQLLDINQNILFTSAKGGGLTTVQIFRLFQSYCRKAKIPSEKAHPHALRHSIAMQMSESGRSIEEVQAHLRHRDIKSTTVYYRVSSKRRLAMQEEVLNTLEF